MSLTWKLHRLSAMDNREIAYRARQQLRAGLQRIGVGTARVPAEVARQEGRAWTATLPINFNKAKYRDAAEQILHGRFNVFAMQSAELGFPPQWNRDPKTLRNAPLKFGHSLDYRDERMVGDIKYLWEPSRHAELVTLAQAWYLTKDVRYSEGCRVLLDSWIEQCPYMRGAHWTSSLEHAVRLLNWSMAWHLLGGENSPLFAGPGAEFKERWLKSIYQHCHFIAGHFSRFSSANNHLLGELAGLFIAALTWPKWQSCTAWRDRARVEFEQEALKQNGSDGVNKEQANWYHHEVADMMLLAGLYARANDCDFSAAFWQRLEAMLVYIASIMDCAGQVPNFGDADDAILARLDPNPAVDVYRSLLATGAVLFQRTDFKFKAGVFDDKSQWLLGVAGAKKFASLPIARVEKPARCAFEEAGYYVLGAAYESPREIRLVVDGGPLGYSSIAAHGHADALSFTLSAGGQELLIDPGTYAYHTQKKWRDYFRGTSAHNTVRVDGKDQSIGAGNFLWLAHARSRVERFSSTTALQCFIGEHDGYRRLPDPVTHRRELTFLPEHSTLSVVDHLQCQKEHDVELHWHFAEGCNVQLNQNVVIVRRENVELTMTMLSGLSCESLRGQETPPLGWVSRSFDSRTATTTVRASARIHGETRIVTEIVVQFDLVD